MSMDNISLSDIASVTRDNDGFGGGNMGFFWIFALLILLGGGNGFGFNRMGEFGQYATSASQNEILLGQKFDALGQKVNSIGDGICSSTYALNNAIQGEGRALQTQLAESTANTNSVTVAQTQKILDAISTNRMAEMQNQINQLQMQNAMCGVVRYPSASTYYAGANPFCSNGCGCGNY